MKGSLLLMFGALAVVGSQAFAPVGSMASTRSRMKPSVELSALWRHWIPEPERDFLGDSTHQYVPRRQNQTNSEHTETDATNFLLGSLLALVLVVAPSQSVLAVSGGGLDYAGLDITGQDFSKADYKNKDFTQVIAKGTNFAGSNLQGCRFYKSYLVNADFTGSDITGASLEGTSMDGASLKNVVAKGSYFSNSILDTASVENADFSDAQFPPKVLPLLCDRPDMKGTNPTTGADTRESAMCP